MVIIAVIAALVLAFANGANDNIKGVATLIGGRTMTFKKALAFAAMTTFLGSVMAVTLAQGLLNTFSGKGLVDPKVCASPTFLSCVGLSAAVTVLLATRLGMPISTTHAMVGGITGVGLSAHALDAPKLVGTFVVPLLVAPVVALVIAAAVYPLFRWVRLRLGVTRQTCICIEQEFSPVSIASDGSLLLAATGVKLGREYNTSDCLERYDGQVVGLDAQRVLDWFHYLSAGAIGFARGLNDTPKIAAIMITVGAVAPGGATVAVGVGIAIGGLLAARRVANTMSYRITGMNDGQAFTGNLVTAACVIFASRLGAPVSTTHVSCGSLFGIGLVNGQAHLNVIGQILLAWLTTLPVAAAIGWVTWRLSAG